MTSRGSKPSKALSNSRLHDQENARGKQHSTGYKPVAGETWAASKPSRPLRAALRTKSCFMIVANLP
jgi:hypothetical protein